MSVSKLIFNGGLLELNEAEYEKNLEYANEIKNYYLSTIGNKGPRIGEILMRKNGEIHRFTVAHEGGALQAGAGVESYGFYVDHCESSFSGTCGDLVDHDSIDSSDDFELARFWFFNQCSLSKAHQGIHFDMLVRVWTEK